MCKTHYTHTRYLTFSFKTFNFELFLIPEKKTHTHTHIFHTHPLFIKPVDLIAIKKNREKIFLNKARIENEKKNYWNFYLNENFGILLKQ